jgi:hypothetical protein
MPAKTGKVGLQWEGCGSSPRGTAEKEEKKVT